MARFQQHPAWCGPASIQNALEAMGVRVSQKKIATLAGTTDDGTDELGIIRALKALKVKHITFWEEDQQIAEYWLETRVRLGLPVILCVDSWDHWVCVAGNFGPRRILLDSDLTSTNRARNGVHHLLTRTIMKRWRAGRKVISRGEPRFYGIAIDSKPGAGAGPQDTGDH